MADIGDFIFNNGVAIDDDAHNTELCSCGCEMEFERNTPGFKFVVIDENDNESSYFTEWKMSHDSWNNFMPRVNNIQNWGEFTTTINNSQQTSPNSKEFLHLFNIFCTNENDLAPALHYNTRIKFIEIN
jgi:hypothetical protein